MHLWNDLRALLFAFTCIGSSLLAQKPNDAELINAIRSNNAKQVVALLDKGANANAENDLRESAMTTAIKLGNFEIIESLLSHGATQKGGLEIAVEANNSKLVEYLLEKGFYTGESMVYASENNNIELARLLIHYGAAIDIVQKRKNGLFRKEFVSPIQFAVYNDNIEMTLLYVNHGIEVDKALEFAFKYDKDELLKPLIDKCSSKEKLLFVAAEFNEINALAYIISKGISELSTNEKGNTILHVGSENGNLEIVQYALNELHMNIEEKNKEGSTPFMLGVHSNKLEIVRFLLENKAMINEIDNHDKNALFYIVDNNREMFQLLINAGANISQEAKDKTTLLINAAKNKNYEIIRYLLENGANIHAKDDLGYTAFQYLISPYNRNEVLIDMFLEKGADINAGDVSGKSMMYYAIEREHLQKVKTLKDKGAKCDVYDERGYRPRVDEREIIIYIVDNGANINSLDSRHDSYLCNAIYNNDLELAHYLVDNGIDVNTECYFEEPPLIKAIEDDNIVLVKFLVDNGADVNAEGYFKKNVMDYAEKKSNPEIIAYLESHGSMNKNDRNELFRRTMEMERKLREDIRLKDEEKLAQDLKACTDLEIQHRILKEIAIFSASQGNLIIPEILSSRFGFDLNTPLNIDQQTMLMLAVINDKTTLVSYLLGKSIDTDREDIYKKKAHDYAKSKAMRKLI